MKTFAQAGVDAAGNAVIVADHGRSLVATRRPVGRDWTDPVVVQHGTSGVLAVGADGTTLVFKLEGKAKGAPQLVATRWVRGTRWSAPVALAIEPYSWHPPSVGIDASGRATVARETTTHSILATQLSADGTWAPPVTVGVGDAEVYSIGIAVNGNGDALLAWGRRRQTLEAAFHSADQGWVPVQTVSVQSAWIQGPAIDAAGNAVVGWTNAEGVVRARWWHTG